MNELSAFFLPETKPLQPELLIHAETALTLNRSNSTPPLTWYKDSDKDGCSDGTTQTSSTRPGNDYYLASELKAISGDCDDNNANRLPKDCALDSDTIVGTWDFVGTYGSEGRCFSIYAYPK